MSYKHVVPFHMQHPLTAGCGVAMVTQLTSPSHEPSACLPICILHYTHNTRQQSKTYSDFVLWHCWCFDLTGHGHWSPLSLQVHSHLPTNTGGRLFWGRWSSWWQTEKQNKTTTAKDDYSLSLHFNGHFPGEPGLAGVHWSKGWWRSWWQLEV